jgi:hypothetical protein
LEELGLPETSICIDWFAIPLELSPKFEICHASAAHKNSPLAKRLKN